MYVDDVESQVSITADNTVLEYHVCCYKCGHTWWSFDAFPKACPHCGVKIRYIPVTSVQLKSAD